MTIEATSPTVGERLRRDWPWAVMLLVIVVTAGVLIVAKLTDDEYETSVGQIVYSAGEVTGHRSYVELPAGQLSVVVSKPRSSLPDYGEGTRPAAATAASSGSTRSFAVTTHYRARRRRRRRTSGSHLAVRRWAHLPSAGRSARP